jgi:hypothetical protein
MYILSQFPAELARGVDQHLEKAGGRNDESTNSEGVGMYCNLGYK